MKYRYDPSVRSFQQPLGGQGQGPQNQGNSPFPGISDPFMNKSIGMAPVPFDTAEFSNGVPSINIMPASNQQIIPLPEAPSSTSVADALAETKPEKAKKEKGGFNLGESINDLKGVVDRMGGLDGIVTTMTKVQKVVGSITQMAPLIKVLAGSFGKKGASATIAEDDDDYVRPRRPRKRKRRKTASGKGLSPNGVKRKRPRR
ncbi:hypothetical protein [Paenibacillus sacheonensis]|uniref:Tyrosine protein kinase n=1 Tax=Paenibacillus sacheonensis TaxID=742054 RepID=A0A7X5C1P2_9BACL|nr:hypothetical protein [Paenibacillus sacheonensis]NBC72901.1 hypothetical protein [Paenibacillus sacheonensis]